MGSGKTTLCRSLSRMTGVATVDLDDFIVEKSGMPIKEYFSRYGENGFREFEHDCLAELSKSLDDVIIACGGGTPCYGDNMELMNRTGTTILLEADFERLLARLMLGREQRPLIADLDDDGLRRFIKDKLDERTPYYERAACRFDSSQLETEQEIESTSKRFIDIYMSDFSNEE